MTAVQFALTLIEDRMEKEEELLFSRTEDICKEEAATCSGGGSEEDFMGERCVTCVDVWNCWISAQVDVPVHRFLEIDRAFVGLDDPEPVGWWRADAVHKRQAEGKDDENKTEAVLHCVEPRDLTRRSCRRVVDQSFVGSKRKRRAFPKGSDDVTMRVFDAVGETLRRDCCWRHAQL